MIYFIITCMVLVTIAIALFLDILAIDWLNEKNRKMEIKQFEKDWEEKNNDK